MPSETVSAVPLALLELPRRTEGPDRRALGAAASLDAFLAAASRGGAGAAAGPGLGAATAAHVARARTVVELAGATGIALFLAGGPHTVATIAALLGHEALAALARSRPHLVGPVDGMPVELRYDANRRIALHAADAFDAAGDDERADALRALAAPGRQLLFIDPERGLAAEVLGDLRGADHVAVVVPGMANTIESFGTVRRKAAALRAAAAGLDPPEDLATIAWLGYETPLVDVVLDDAARAGAPRLAGLIDGLGASGIRADATLTVVAHSYGTVVAGLALREGLTVDAVAVTGSPGMRADAASELGTVPIYALRAPGDYVSWSQYHGMDPSDPDFGATRLDTGDIGGHNAYFEAGTVGLTNLALVATGRADQATVVAPDGFDSIGGTLDDLRAPANVRVDVTQELVGAAAGTVSALTDLVEDHVPDTVAGIIDGAQDAAGTGLELGNGMVDLAQRLTSPDLAADIAGDVLDALFD